MKKSIIAIAILVIALTTAADTAFARGGGGGGRSSGGSRSSPSRTVSPTPRPTVAPTVKPTVAPVAKPYVATKPTAQQKADYAKSLKTNKTVATTKKTSTGKTLSTKSKTIGSGYNPKFRNGSTYPAGSTVYYPQRDFLDYLPWIFLLTMDSHRQAVIYPPATASSTAAITPIEDTEEGVDTMYVINWIIMILLTGGIIAGIMYLINKKTK